MTLDVGRGSMFECRCENALAAQIDCFRLACRDKNTTMTEVRQLVKTSLPRGVQRVGGAEAIHPGSLLGEVEAAQRNGLERNLLLLAAWPNCWGGLEYNL